MDETFKPRQEQRSGEGKGRLHGEQPETGKATAGGWVPVEDSRQNPQDSTVFGQASWGDSRPPDPPGQTYPGQWQPPFSAAQGYGSPAGAPIPYGRIARKKRIYWPFIAAASLLAVAAIAGGMWLLLQPRSYEAIAEECENTSTLSFLALFTGFSETIEEHGDPDDEFWDEVPTFIRVSGDSSSLNVYDRSGMSLDALEMLDGASGSSRDRGQEFIDEWNGMRDLALMGVVGCVHEELDIPDSVERRMLSTRALDGAQELVHSGTRIMWSYHPSQGIDVLYEKE